MNNNELQFRITCIEYLKAMDNSKVSSEIQTILRRSDIHFIKTNIFRRGNVWNQRNMDTDLRVPIPLLNRANELKDKIDGVFKKIYLEDEQYGYGFLNIGPKMIGSADIIYKEYDVIFDNIQKTIIQGIRDAKYVIWIAVAWFTDEEIYRELCLRKEDGINIRIITSGDNSNGHILENLKKMFDTVTVTLPGKHIFHNKFCIIDFEYVMHGSYNWSKNAQENEETWSTALDRDFAEEFADKFMNIYRTQKIDDEDNM